MDERKRGAMLRREYEKMLQAAGLSKAARVKAANRLQPAEIAKLLPTWRRIRVELMR